MVVAFPSPYNSASPHTPQHTQRSPFPPTGPRSQLTQPSHHHGQQWDQLSDTEHVTVGSGSSVTRCQQMLSYRSSVLCQPMVLPPADRAPYLLSGQSCMGAAVGRDAPDGPFQLRIFQGSLILPSGYEGFCIVEMGVPPNLWRNAPQHSPEQTNPVCKNLQVETTAIPWFLISCSAASSQHYLQGSIKKSWHNRAHILTVTLTLTLTLTLILTLTP